MAPRALLLLALLGAPDAGPPPRDYRARVAAVEARRTALASRLSRSPRARREVLDEARLALADGIREELIPAWLGTPWDFYGTSETPGEGRIACGYFVSTVLRDAGVRVDRAPLARQASERIVQTLCPEERIWRFRDAPVSQVVGKVRREGPGIYVVGFDAHVGFLVHDGAAVRFCHASVCAPAAVTCEDPETAPCFVSRYHVVGKLGSDAMVEDWLRGRSRPIFGS